MNKNLNLVEILKDCPQGTKLYSTIHGEVEFVEIRNNCTDYPIIYEFKDKDGDCCMGSTTLDGRFTSYSKGECVLFPSKDQRDWSRFNIEPKFDISTLQPFDRVLVRLDNRLKWRCNFFGYYISSNYHKFNCPDSAYPQCIPYNEETKHLVGTTEMPPKKYINWEE